MSESIPADWRLRFGPQIRDVWLGIRVSGEDTHCFRVSVSAGCLLSCSFVTVVVRALVVAVVVFAGGG